jgi:hypothetical protein
MGKRRVVNCKLRHDSSCIAFVFMVFLDSSSFSLLDVPNWFVVTVPQAADYLR